ncbi:DUF4232 domain-containing protein [Agromyces archimandritae]|uniref:DUF4232 domain-containing protein n=1 Tax=Agromyces archimandritae TaxID=2781962 RepID=A0A975FPP0_9MICO|nr:DUF4232 domain-containing protein [Agromyces archimandritae]QTX05383.1 DUF4232 domain-containing protein [Agromyces archimandritae]
MPATRMHPAAPATLFAAAVLTLVGCTAPTGETPTTLSAEASPTAAAAPRAKPVGPKWSDERCVDEQLTAEVVARREYSDAEIERFTIVLTNASDQACSYFGWPGVLLLDDDGNVQTSTDTSIGSKTPEPGTLAPGESTHTDAELTRISTYDCTPTIATTTRVRVTSDGAGPGIDAPSLFEVCADDESHLATGPQTPAP